MSRTTAPRGDSFSSKTSAWRDLVGAPEDLASTRPPHSDSCRRRSRPEIDSALDELGMRLGATTLIVGSS